MTITQEKLAELCESTEPVTVEDLDAIDYALKVMTPVGSWAGCIKEDVVANPGEPPIVLARNEDVRFLAAALMFMGRLSRELRQLKFSQ